MPRDYRMTNRAAGVAATRSRIVATAMRLHAERGIAATSWPDIAAAAGVSNATVYRHFAEPSALISACGRAVFDIAAPPAPEDAAAQFADMGDASDRFAHLARESAHCYERGEDWLHAAHRERAFDPDLNAVITLFQDSLHVLVDAAARRRLPATSHALLFTLCDFPFWKSLVDAGLTRRRAETELVSLVRTQVARLGLSTQEER